MSTTLHFLFSFRKEHSPAVTTHVTLSVWTRNDACVCTCECWSVWLWEREREIEGWRKKDGQSELASRNALCAGIYQMVLDRKPGVLLIHSGTHGPTHKQKENYEILKRASNFMKTSKVYKNVNFKFNRLISTCDNWGVQVWVDGILHSGAGECKCRSKKGE